MLQELISHREVTGQENGGTNGMSSFILVRSIIQTHCSMNSVSSDKNALAFLGGEGGRPAGIRGQTFPQRET